MPDPSPRVHPVADAGFGQGAHAYVRARPGYPPAALRLLADLGVGPGRRVLDLGAGTGKLTTGLVALGADVVAVEPVAAMRAALVAGLPEVDVLDGTAEAIPLADGSVDVATVAQAFHWFDGPRALAELRRVIRPGGGLALLWNVRDETVDWVRRWTDIVATHGGGRPYGAGHGEDPARLVGADGGFGPVDVLRLRNDQPTTPALLVERAASTSFVAALPPARRARALRAVADLLATHPHTAGRDALVMPHETVVYRARRRPEPVAASGPPPR